MSGKHNPVGGPTLKKYLSNYFYASKIANIDFLIKDGQLHNETEKEMAHKISRGCFRSRQKPARTSHEVFFKQVVLASRKTI